MSNTPLVVSRVASQASLGFTKWGWWSASYESKAAPIIIGGSPRTGSTLLRVMLSRHPQIWIGPENGVFQEGGQNLAGMEACLGVPAARLRAIRRRACCLGEFIDLVMAESLAAYGKPIWGIKSPSVVDSMEMVFRFFPRARFVHIVRDGRDVVCSLRTHPKYQRVDGKQVLTGIVNSWDGCVQRWKESTQRALRWRGDPRYSEVRYEELVGDPQKTLHKLCAGLGIPYDEAMVSGTDQAINEGIDTPHPGIGGAVYHSATERWKTDLPSEAIAAFDAESRDLLVELNYAEKRVVW